VDGSEHKNENKKNTQEREIKKFLAAKHKT
jgi:hypothetical protein